MKHYFLAVIMFIGLNSRGQDSAKSIGNSSVSFYVGANVITGIAPLTFYNLFGAVEPGTSTQPYFSFSYNYLFHPYKHFSLGLKLGIGYSQNEYYGKIPSEIVYTTDLLERMNSGEFCVGVFANIAKKNKVSWYNELDFTCNIQLGSPIFYSMVPLLDMSDFSNRNDIDMHLFYQTGISISVSRNFTLIPLVGCSLIDFSAVFNRVNPYGIYGYLYLRAGMTLTYYLNKK